MPSIRFLPSGKTIECPTGTSLLDAARNAQIDIDSECGGTGTCGQCKVRVISGTVQYDDRGSLEKKWVDQGYVLACHSYIQDSPVILEIPEPIQLKGGQFAELVDESTQNLPPFLPENWQYHGLTTKYHLQVPPAQLEDGQSDLDRLQKSLLQLISAREGASADQQPHSKKIHASLPFLQKLAETIRKQNGDVDVIVYDDGLILHLIDLEAGQSSRDFGLAIDIGTTSIAVQLISLPDAHIVGTNSDYNDQIKCGQDVISRINYAARPGGLSELQTRVVQTINRLIQQLISAHQIEGTQIHSAVISGNTTMIHLLLRLIPEHLRLDPYTPTVLSVPNLTAHELGLMIHPHAVIYCSPAVGSYVGGDITAGILCTSIDQTSAPSLFIDIGTNGELVIGNTEYLMTCACSAGPAFEGAELEWGMRAVTGAIDDVHIDRSTGRCTVHTIGNGTPLGICGTGVIALLAHLFLTGWLDAAGKLRRDRPCSAIEIIGRSAKYHLVPAPESGRGKPITISEAEIANILRAKAAIYSAISLILQQLELSPADLHMVYIGGNFGRFLNLENAILIGLLPDLPHHKFQYIGNSSLMGSYLLLVSAEARQRQVQLAQKMTYLELNTDPSYMDQYTSALFLPHTDLERFPTVKKALQHQD